MKSLLFVTVLLCLGDVAHAQCVLTENTLMYIDPWRCAAMINMIKTSRQDAMNLMKLDVEEGSAIHVPAGTRLDWVEEQPKGFTIVGIGGDKLISFTPEIKRICK